MSTLSRAYEYGRIVSVDLIPLGGSLAADAASAATSITVEDASDFDENGGSLLLNGVVYAYSTWTEDDATGVGTITIPAPGLTGAAVEGDMVAVYDTLYLTASTFKQAEVAVTGDDGNVDTLPAAIADHLVDKIDEGIRGLTGESVKLELDGDEWVIVDIYGLGDPNASGAQFLNTDTMTVTVTGAQAFPLTRLPITGSEHVRWGGVDLLPSEWSRAGRIVTIPTPNYAKVGDIYTAAYAYRVGLSETVVGWGSTGPNLVVAEGDSTDRSAVSFDDSTWTRGAAPLGYPLSQVPGSDWPVAVTSIVSSNAGLWIRRKFTLASPVTVQVFARADGQYWLYADGTLLDSYTGSTAQLFNLGPFAVTLQAGTHVIALHVNDDTSDPGSDWTYGDIQVTT